MIREGLYMRINKYEWKNVLHYILVNYIYIYIYSIDTVLNETEIKEKYVRNTPELVKQ